MQSDKEVQSSEKHGTSANACEGHDCCRFQGAHLGTVFLDGWTRGGISIRRYFFRRLPVRRVSGVPPSAVPDTAKYGGIFLRKHRPSSILSN